jgi:hypothetical protein
VKNKICQNRRETAHVWLEAIARADNPYSLLQVFGQGHVITKSGVVTYVTRCNPVELVPRVSPNSTKEILITWNDTTLFVDHISSVIKSAALPSGHNDRAPPWWWWWYCGHPYIWECAHARDLPVEAVQVDKDNLLDLGLGRSIYSKVQVEEFLKFQDSQGTQIAYLAETAGLAYRGCSKDRS